MHNSYFSTNEQLLDQAVGKYWTNRADAIAQRKAAAIAIANNPECEVGHRKKQAE
jgi:hypothetical protein